MTDVTTPAAAPPVNGGRPTFSHPAIPPPKATAKPVATTLMPGEQGRPAAKDVQSQEPEPKAEEVEAKPPEDDGPEQVEYFPDDEFSVTVDGKEQTVTMAKLLASYQRNEASNARFAEAKQLKAAAISMLDRAMTPEGFLEVAKLRGRDPYAIAEDIILERYNYERMTAQEREMHDYKREREQWDRQKAQETQTAEQRKQEQAAQQFQAHFLEVGVAMMDRLSVPADTGLRNELIGRAASIYRADRQAGYESTPQAAMQDAWEDYQKRLETHARALPVDRRLSDEERATIAQKNAAERVRVAQQAPKGPSAPPRDESGKFAPAQKPRMDMWNPQKR